MHRCFACDWNTIVNFRCIILCTYKEEWTRQEKTKYKMYTYIHTHARINNNNNNKKNMHVKLMHGEVEVGGSRWIGTGKQLGWRNVLFLFQWIEKTPANNKIYVRRAAQQGRLKIYSHSNCIMIEVERYECIIHDWISIWLWSEP